MVFQILAKIEMTRNKNWLFGRHFETVQHFHNFFFQNCDILVHTYMVQISLQNSGREGIWNPPDNNYIGLQWTKWSLYVFPAKAGDTNSGQSDPYMCLSC